jgi:hypothetical protein
MVGWFRSGGRAQICNSRWLDSWDKTWKETTSQHLGKLLTCMSHVVVSPAITRRDMPCASRSLTWQRKIPFLFFETWSMNWNLFALPADWRVSQHGMFSVVCMNPLWGLSRMPCHDVRSKYTCFAQGHHFSSKFPFESNAPSECCFAKRRQSVPFHFPVLQCQRADKSGWELLGQEVSSASHSRWT